ncbi:MAG TPA: hypothetical protein VIU63_06260 [Nitrospira sp.]
MIAPLFKEEDSALAAVDSAVAELEPDLTATAVPVVEETVAD